MRHRPTMGADAVARDTESGVGGVEKERRKVATMSLPLTPCHLQSPACFLDLADRSSMEQRDHREAFLEAVIFLDRHQDATGAARHAAWRVRPRVRRAVPLFRSRAAIRIRTC